MIYEGDLYDLITQWKDRATINSKDFSYTVAVNECIHDLDQFIMKELGEEMHAREYLDEQNADAILSSLESHEIAA